MQSEIRTAFDTGLVLLNLHITDMAKKKKVVFTVTCPKEIGSVGRDFFFLFYFIFFFNSNVYVWLSLCFKSAIL